METHPPVRATAGEPGLAPRPPASHRLAGLELGVLAVASVTVLAASYLRWWSIAPTEAWGFVTGGVCVWLVVRENPWNWPIGMANNVAFFVVFLQSRLYADMGLQVVYFALSGFGWLNWVFGGERRTELAVSRATRREWITLLLAVPAGTWALQEILVRVNGAAPFWDSLTTVLSLAAQYLLTRKRIENWWFWITADLIYVPLYLSRDLRLTAALYALFLVLCVIGWRAWRRGATAAGRSA